MSTGEFITDNFLLWQGSNISSPALSVFLVLLSYIDWSKGTCFPSVSTIANKCGYKDSRPVYPLLNELYAIKLISKSKGTKGRSNKYTFLTWDRKSKKLFSPIRNKKVKTETKGKENIDDIADGYFS